MSSSPDTILLFDNITTVNNGTTGLPYSLAWTIIAGTLTAICSLATVGGNLLVIAAFFIERTLRTPTNYFIASLAVTDLLIGVFSMNFFTLYILLGYWPLGELFCDLWLSLDYTACLTSQYTVFFITVDRYCSVRIPAKYRNWRTDRRVLIMVAATWVLPSSIFFTTIMGWPYFTNPENRRKVTDCYAEFVSSPIFNTILTIGYFWITLIVMFVLYGGIYHVALNLQKKSDAKRRKMTSLVSMAGQTMSRIGVGVSKATDDENDDDGDDDCDDENESSSRQTHSRNYREQDNNEQTQTLVESHGKQSGNVGTRGGVYQTTSFTHRVEQNSPDDERSSSPMLPSDSDANCTPIPVAAPVLVNKRKKHKLPETTKSPILANIKSPVIIEVPANQAPLPPPLLSPLHPNQSPHSGGLTTVAGRRMDTNPTPTTSNDSDYHTASGLSSDMGDSMNQPLLSAGQNSDGFYQSQTTGSSLPPNAKSAAQDQFFHVYALSANPERFEGLKYIDQDSLKSLPSSDNVKLLLEILPKSGSLEGDANVFDMENKRGSPIWKKRPFPLEFKEPCETDAMLPLNGDASGGEGVDDSSMSMSNSRNACGGSSEEGASGKPLTPIREVNSQISYSNVNNNVNNNNNSTIVNVTNQTTSSTKAAQGKKEGRGRFLPLTIPLREVTKRFRHRKKKEKVERGRSENRARKALRTISLILGAFVVCWTPYHIIILIKGFCDVQEPAYTCINDHLYNISYWLCYINSPINPFCYALANAQFKKAFLRILRCDLHRT